MDGTACLGDAQGLQVCVWAAEMRMLSREQGGFYSVVLVPVVDSESGFLPASSGEMNPGQGLSPWIADTLKG